MLSQIVRLRAAEAEAEAMAMKRSSTRRPDSRPLGSGRWWQPRRSTVRKAYPMVLFLGVAFVAAAILVSVEGPAEDERLAAKALEDQILQVSRDAQLTGIWNVLDNACLEPERCREAKKNVTYLYQEMTYLIDTYVKTGAQADKNWTYIGALYFIFTIVTTIGYGTFAPTTDGGRTLTVCIAMVGIAIFASMLEALASGVGYALHKLYAKLACDRNADPDNKKSRRSEQKMRVAFTVTVIVSFWLLSALLFESFSNYHADEARRGAREQAAIYEAAGLNHNSYIERAKTFTSWGFGESMYYTAITFLTIGLGDFSVAWFGRFAVLEVLLFVVVACLGISFFIELTQVCMLLPLLPLLPYPLPPYCLGIALFIELTQACMLLPLLPLLPYSLPPYCLGISLFIELTQVCMLLPPLPLLPYSLPPTSRRLPLI